MFDLKGGFWRERYFTRLDVLAFSLRMFHVLFTFGVDLVDIFLHNLCHRTGFMCLTKAMNQPVFNQQQLKFLRVFLCCSWYY